MAIGYDVIPFACYCSFGFIDQGQKSMQNVCVLQAYPLIVVCLSSIVHRCLFLMCATDVLCFMFRRSSMKSSIVLCYNINKLTYLLIATSDVSID